MAKRRIRYFLLSGVMALALFFLLLKSYLPGLSPKSDSYKHYQLLNKVVYLIKDDYVEVPNPNTTMHGAFKGLVDSLDVLSSYLEKNSVSRYIQRKDSRLKETGLVLYKTYGSFPIIIGVKENSPAEKMGIKIGEAIASIDDKSTLSMSMLEANLFQKQIDNQPITLKIVRPDKNEEYKIERALLNANPFSFQAAEGTSGILIIHTFFPSLVELLQEKMLTRMQAQKKPLILDLRNCHEGEIGEAVKFINLFLQKETIGYFEKKNGIRNNLACPQEAPLSLLPLVIWTNQATMGPAEIVATVLKTEKNARIIGGQTLGLTAKQNLYTLEDGSGVLLTSAIFHPASQDMLWLKGVKPDINIQADKQNQASYLEETQKIILNN